MPSSPPPLIEALRHRLQRDPTTPVRVIETHISWVLLDGRHAWKIKKPVRLGFLDFAELETRRHYCTEELRLNRRLAPDLYEAVVAVRGSTNVPRVDGHDGDDRGDSEGDDAPIEYVLRMKQFASGALLSEKLAAGKLEPRHVDLFAQRIAAFHETAATAGEGTGHGSPESIRETFAQLLDGLDGQLGTERCAGVRAWLEAEARRLHETFERRRAEGWVRECHGDLHLANVVVLGDEVTAFDCIEFDPALRWIDVQCDVAFLVMDLLARDRRDMAFRFLDGWLERSGDYAGLAVLRCYTVYRALVRALVAAIRRSQGIEADGPDYLALAERLIGDWNPRLLITHGLSGSGKSFVSQRLLERAGAIRMRSDVERKRLFGLRALEQSSTRTASDIYGADATRRTFARLAELAGRVLDAGHPVIVDAAFLLAGERRDFADLARARKLPFAILHCYADPRLLRERIQLRLSSAADPSEADLAVLERQLASHDALDETERALAIEVDTARTADIDTIVARWFAGGT